VTQNGDTPGQRRPYEPDGILDEIFSHSPAFMTFLSVPDYRYLKSNGRHDLLLRKNDIIGKSLFEVLPEMEAQGIARILDEVVRSGRPYVAKEMPITYADHGGPRTVYLDFVYHPVRRPDGVIYGISVQGYEVTEAVLSRQAIENERRNFRNLFRETPEMVCILKGPAHVFEFVNEAHVRVLGFDATGKSVREAPPESVEVHGILDEVYRTGRTAHLNEIPVTVGDRLRHFNLTYAARRDERDAIDGIMILGIEVTEQVRAREQVRRAEEVAILARRHAEEAAGQLERAVAERTRELRDSQVFLDSVVENIPHMVFIKDAVDLRFVRFNRAGEELLGIPRDELIGRNDYDFFPKEQADHFIARDREVLAGRRAVDTPEEPIETRDHGRRILRTRKMPILGTDGRPRYLLGVSEDVTEWKRAEQDRIRVAREQAAVEERARETERNAFLAEATSVLASSLDYHRTLSDLARLAVRGLGDWCTVTVMKDDGTRERIAFVHRDPALQSVIDDLARSYPAGMEEDAGIGRVIATGEPIVVPCVDDGFLAQATRDARHLELIRKLGCKSCIVVPILSRGQILGAISVISASEERTYGPADLATVLEFARRAGIAIDNALLYEAAQRAVKARDDFLSIASHELKTPLTSLQLQTQIRRREVERGQYARFAPDRLPKLIADDEKQISRLARLVDDMLDISLMQTGKLSFNQEEFDLVEMTGDILARMSAQIEASGCRVDLEAPEPVTGRWDRFRIEQVLVNLVTNALKYGAKAAITVRVHGDETHARLSVSDRGIGIATEHQSRIFGRFERAVVRGAVGGLGLGLYISKRIVEAHGGKITVRSALGQGATFEVTLPRRSVETTAGISVASASDDAARASTERFP
jgi:PAS domain S-box-containing protein